MNTCAYEFIREYKYPWGAILIYTDLCRQKYPPCPLPTPEYTLVWISIVSTPAQCPSGAGIHLGGWSDWRSKGWSDSQSDSSRCKCEFEASAG